MAGNPIAAFAPATIVTDNATQTIDCSSASHFRWTLGANRTVSTFLNPVGGQVIEMETIQDATGSRTLTWPTNVNWPAATAPTLTTTAAKRDRFQFRYNSATATWDGNTLGLNYT